MSFLLAYELLGERSASRVVYVLHGVLGSGQNFRGVVRHLQKRRPDLLYVLVDLRNHGASTPAPPPQTLAACAADLVALSDHLRTRGMPAPRSIVGHSFGGKVALEASPCLRFGSGDQVFLLDSNPGAFVPQEDHEVLRVIRAVRSVSMPAASRAEVVQRLQGQGMSSGLANWMTTNLKREEDVYRWRFDLDAIELLLEDYFAVDAWPAIEAAVAGPDIHFVVAENSDRFNPALRQRAAQAAARRAQVFLHMIPNAGHWLHVDNPAALLDLLSDRLG